METANEEDPPSDIENRNEEEVAFTDNKHDTGGKQKPFQRRKQLGRRNLALIVSHVGLIVIVIILVVYFTGFHDNSSTVDQGNLLEIRMRFVAFYDTLLPCQP